MLKNSKDDVLERLKNIEIVFEGIGCIERLLGLMVYESEKDLVSIIKELKDDGWLISDEGVK